VFGNWINGILRDKKKIKLLSLIKSQQNFFAKYMLIKISK